MNPPVPGVPDPLMPGTSRFLLMPSGGRVMPSSAPPSGQATRPFGLRYAVRPVECGKHSKRPTNKTRTEQTQITDDGRVVGVKPDTVHYVEMDEE
ncbi:MAG: hypothetical protein GEU83_07505 [Pseudonocardiaceae bacterium]|nr:hypothetical protein [Pseudonocardiaceae bacterium]